MKKKNIKYPIFITMAVNKEVFPLLLLAIMLTLITTSCKKFIEVDAPSTSTTTELVYSSDSKAIAAMTGVYALMSSYSFNGNGFLSLSLSPELSGDNLTLFLTTNSKFTPYYKNILNSQYNGSTTNSWSQLYSIIYNSNAVLEGINSSTKLTITVKNQLLGEAYFVRALCYFYLTNLYGNVPLTLSTDYASSAILPRAAQKSVYDQILTDLKTSKSLISDHYLDSKLAVNTDERLRPNKYTVSALLARTYLYTGDYLNAESEATSIINNTTDYGLVDLNQVFIKNSRESIWSIQPIAIGQNTPEALFYFLPATGPSNSNPAYLSSGLIESFETNDQRKSNWTSQVTIDTVSYYFPTKYRITTYNAPVTEYSVVFRLAEQYLIRAEARVMQNNLSTAKDDIRVIRSRAGLGESPSKTKEEIIAAILHERRVEYFTEFGARWFDLKRTGKINAVMTIASPLKGTTWNTNAQLYPVPQFDITRNRNLSQNPGY